MNRIQNTFVGRPKLALTAGALVTAPIAALLFAIGIYDGSYRDALISGALFSVFFVPIMTVTTALVQKKIYGRDGSKIHEVLREADAGNLGDRPDLWPAARGIASRSLARTNSRFNKVSSKFLPYLLITSSLGMVLVNYDDNQIWGAVFWAILTLFWITAIYWFPRTQAKAITRMESVLEQIDEAEAKRAS